MNATRPVFSWASTLALAAAAMDAEPDLPSGWIQRSVPSGAVEQCGSCPWGSWISRAPLSPEKTTSATAEISRVAPVASPITRSAPAVPDAVTLVMMEWPSGETQNRRAVPRRNSAPWPSWSRTTSAGGLDSPSR
jgi:hypothetical protein